MIDIFIPQFTETMPSCFVLDNTPEIIRVSMG